MYFPPFGFGCYRVDYRVEEHKLALRKAILAGITFIDTSSNYSDGGSEKLVGDVVKELIREGEISREDVTIVTKGGYLQGSNYKDAVKRRSEGQPYPEVTEYDNGLWHCIHPEFLAEQFIKQRQRLGSFDCYLLHNPEYFLNHEKEKGTDVNAARTEYYRRIRNAFKFLELKVREGIIHSYGVSSNTFPVVSHRYDFTSLEKLVEIANDISEINHFKVVQMPFNLMETGAYTEKNQADGSKTVIEIAAENNIHVVFNRPLNAITEKGLVRLADYEVSSYSERDFIKQLNLTVLTEDDLINEKLSYENITVPQFNKLKQAAVLGKTIEDNWKFFGSVEHFNDSIEQFFVPRVNFLINFFETADVSESTKEFFEKYLKECYKLLNFVGTYYKIKANQRAKYIHSLIDKNLNPTLTGLTLAQKTLLIEKSVAGTVLVGARKEKYVDDILKVIAISDVRNTDEILEGLKEIRQE